MFVLIVYFRKTESELLKETGTEVLFPRICSMTQIETKIISVHNNNFFYVEDDKQSQKQQKVIDKNERR